MPSQRSNQRSSQRLDSAERRSAIIDAALPLFARKGFAATTTREIAQAAGVSEALIFKHFPSKTALYEAIFAACIDDDPDLARLIALAPSTATLVELVGALVGHFVLDVAADPAELARHRLMIMSFLEDGEFARLVYRGITERIQPAFIAAMRAAEAAGDLTLAPLPPGDGWWFAEHLASMLATVCLPDPSLPGPASVPHACGREELARYATWFILRGLGMRDEVIAACDRAGALSAACASYKDCKEADRDR